MLCDNFGVEFDPIQSSSLAVQSLDIDLICHETFYDEPLAGNNFYKPLSTDLSRNLSSQNTLIDLHEVPTTDLAILEGHDCYWSSQGQLPGDLDPIGVPEIDLTPVLRESGFDDVLEIYNSLKEELCDNNNDELYFLADSFDVGNWEYDDRNSLLFLSTDQPRSATSSPLQKVPVLTESVGYQSSPRIDFLDIQPPVATHVSQRSNDATDTEDDGQSRSEDSSPVDSQSNSVTSDSESDSQVPPSCGLARRPALHWYLIEE